MRSALLNLGDDDTSGTPPEPETILSAASQSHVRSAGRRKTVRYRHGLPALLSLRVSRPLRALQIPLQPEPAGGRCGPRTRRLEARLAPLSCPARSSRRRATAIAWSSAKVDRTTMVPHDSRWARRSAPIAIFGVRPQGRAGSSSPATWTCYASPVLGRGKRTSLSDRVAARAHPQLSSRLCGSGSGPSFWR